uniref:Uncharacterized protein n=1 Tax=Rhizophora mucronata TaxID=61149 RepID=A0A2P2QK04_RHIMU
MDSQGEHDAKTLCTLVIILKVLVWENESACCIITNIGSLFL